MKSPQDRTVETTVAEFKQLLEARKIRPASLDDVQGTHHNRPLYRHPNTMSYYVLI